METPLEVPDDLAARFTGSFVRPGSDEYESRRRIHNGMIDKRPTLIASCVTTADVVDAVRFARTCGAEVSVRGGGHGVAGTAVSDGGLMIDLQPMKGIWIDAERGTGRAQPGVTWREFNRAAALHGLATTGGVVSSTGIAGLTLGGGIGWLMGRYGLTVDNLLSVEMVTANGDVIVADDRTHSDLFWALRGGGGNFGVVTSFEYRMHDVPTVIAGPLLHSWEDAGDALRFHREATRSAPDELTIGAALLASPDGTGAKVAALVPCHCDPATANDDIEAVRAFGRPLVDAVQPMPYPVVNTLLDPAFPAGARNYWKSGFLEELSDPAIDVLVSCYDEVPSPMTGIFLDHLHGAATRVDPAATAFPHRTEAFSVLILGQWATPDETEENIAWVRRTHDALRPHLSGRRYSNFMAADDTALIDDAYDANRSRLTDVKGRYDPDNVFHLNVNVAPA